MLSRNAVAEKFVKGELARNANMRVEQDGPTTVLYSYETPIAWKRGSSLEISNATYSQTTSRQQRAIFSAATSAGYRAADSPSGLCRMELDT